MEQSASIYFGISYGTILLFLFIFFTWFLVIVYSYLTFCVQGALYGSVGFGCGIIGQGIANMIMNAKRYGYQDDFCLYNFTKDVLFTNSFVGYIITIS